jgi:putative PEP-CTERM system TPR-repeat lipoprotein
LQLANMDAIDGKQDLALQRLKKLVESSPTNARAQLALAALRKLMGAKSDELVTLLNNAIKANPTSAELRLGLVQQYLMESQPKLALDAAQEGVSAVPDSLELLAALGRTQLMAGDVNQARISFGKVIKSAPNSAQAHIEMADLQLGQRDFEGALQSLRKAVALAPDNMPAQAKLISLEMNAGRPADALAQARKVQAQRPQSAIGYMFEGDILGEQGKWAAAAKIYQTGMDKQPSTALSVKLHMALVKAGRVADADRQAKAWLQANPKDVVYLNYQGDVQLQRNELVSARQFYERALAAKPNLPAALNNLGWVLSRLKQPGALESVNRALQLVPNQPTFLDTQAEIYAGQGDLKKAIEVQKSAVAAGPDAHPLRLRLAKYYIAAGQPAAAKLELDVLAKLGDAFPQQAEVMQLRAKL